MNVAKQIVDENVAALIDAFRVFDAVPGQIYPMLAREFEPIRKRGHQHYVAAWQQLVDEELVQVVHSGRFFRITDAGYVKTKQ